MPYLVKIFEIVEVLDEAPSWIWALLRLRYLANHILEVLLANHACKTFVNWIKLRCIIFINVMSSPILKRMLKIFDPLLRVRGSPCHGFASTSFLMLLGWIGSHCPKCARMRRSLISWPSACIARSNYLAMANAHSLSSRTGRRLCLRRSQSDLVSLFLRLRRFSSVRPEGCPQKVISPGRVLFQEVLI